MGKKSLKILIRNVIKEQKKMQEKCFKKKKKKEHSLPEHSSREECIKKINTYIKTKVDVWMSLTIVEWDVVSLGPGIRLKLQTCSQPLIMLISGLEKTRLLRYPANNMQEVFEIIWLATQTYKIKLKIITHSNVMELCSTEEISPHFCFICCFGCHS